MKKSTLVIVALCLGFGLVVITAGLSQAANKAPDKFAVVAVLHPYFAPMEIAAKDFMKATGIPTEYRATQHFDMEEENVIIDGMKALGFNAFALWPGHPESVNATITELKKDGIPVILVGGQAKLPTDAALCIATDVAKSAATGTELLIKAMGGKGNIVNLLGELSDPNTLLRKAAIESVIAKYPDVHLLQEIAAVDSFEAATSKIDAFLSSRGKEVDGMISTAYVASVVNSQLLTEIGDKRIKFIAIDDDPKVLKAIKEGYVTGTMSQAPYAQAYIALEGLKLLRDGYTVKPGKYFIDSGAFLIDAGNADTYKEIIRADAQKMLKTFKEDYFNPPK
jgi:ribose transport system substrate-binding protein